MYTYTLTNYMQIRILLLLLLCTNRNKNTLVAGNLSPTKDFILRVFEPSYEMAFGIPEVVTALIS